MFVTSHLMATMIGGGYRPTRMIWGASALSAVAAGLLFGRLKGYGTAFNLVVGGSDFLLAVVFLVTMYAHNTGARGGGLRARLALVSAALLVVISGAGLLAVV